MPTLFIDNKPYEATAGKNLLETCLTLGFDVPYFCWHPALGSVGACRQCAVKVFRNEEDKKGRLVMSCMEPVANDLRLSIDDADAVEFRKHVVEWLMTNHPHDCAVCDEGGSCHLQDMTVMTGHNYRNFAFRKRTYRNQYLGPFLNHEMNRCIQCYRCVRFYKDYAGGNDLDAFASKNNVYFGRHEDGVLENEFSGNLAEVCPTGVFTDKTLKQHYTRKWDLTTAPSVCQHCSLGCNTLAGERYGSLRMISNRFNGEVNGYFLCDRGRFGYEFVNAKERIRHPIIKGSTVNVEAALNEIAGAIHHTPVIGIGSPRASIESNFALKKLVGDNNFYLGVSDKEFWLNNLALKILRHVSVRSSSMKEVEDADVVLVLGEDLTNTAPMLALAVRQSVRQRPLEKVSEAKIPLWNDAAARGLIQQQNGPLFLGSVSSTKLDNIATRTFHGAPESLVRIGFAVAHELDNSSPGVTGLSSHDQSLVSEIASVLATAKRPVIISGTSLKSEAVLMASANVAEALRKKNPQTGIALVLSECNSLGLALLGGRPLKDGFEFVKSQRDCTAIVLENDLYRHANAVEVDNFFANCKFVISADHTTHDTTRKSSIVLPAGTFAEADGTVINNEGRAQRFFQVYESSDDVGESWRWFSRIGSLAGNKQMEQWIKLEDITQVVSAEVPVLNGIERASPPSGFRINGQKIPRESHRFSGRTSILANLNVSEPKPPEDTDSPLSYTMEGFKGLPPSSMIPFFWAPGWNSVQATNKYQEEVGGSLRGGDPGVRLIMQNGQNPVAYFNPVSENVERNKDSFQVVPLYHIFGSEQLSARGEAVSHRVPRLYIALNIRDAEYRQLINGEAVSVAINGNQYELPVVVSAGLTEGLAGLPWGLPGLPYFELPLTVELKRITEPKTVTS
jgi:NADH-quinone oxidoreductase subunit G